MDEVLYLIHSTKTKLPTVKKWSELNVSHVKRGGESIVYPGVYCTLVTKYNIHYTIPFANVNNDSVIVLSKSLLKQKKLSHQYFK